MASQSPHRGKVVVITGASSGFGKGAALELARRGSSVVLAARSAETLSEIARNCEAAGGPALAVPTDVSDRSAVERLCAAAIQKFGHFDVWINDAGVAAIGRFDQVPLEDHEQVVKTDLLGTIYGSYVAMNHFRGRNAGILINVASAIGKIPSPLYSSYVAAKFGIVGFSDALRQELGEENNTTIRVCTVMPLAHDTEFFQHGANYTGHKSVPIPPTYDPRVTIDALVKLVVEPQDEVITGVQGKFANVLHHLMPHAVEKFMAMNTEKAQLHDAPPAPQTSGNLHSPSNS